MWSSHRLVLRRFGQIGTKHSWKYVDRVTTIFNIGLLAFMTSCRRPGSEASRRIGDGRLLNLSVSPS